MALSYNLGYQESISVHPTRSQIFAGIPESTFPNIWQWLLPLQKWLIEEIIKKLLNPNSGSSVGCKLARSSRGQSNTWSPCQCDHQERPDRGNSTEGPSHQRVSPGHLRTSLNPNTVKKQWVQSIAVSDLEWLPQTKIKIDKIKNLCKVHISV